MTKGSDSREFFEVFKQTEKADDTQKKEGKPQDVVKQTINIPVSENKTVASPSVPSVDPLDWIKSTREEEPLSRGKTEVEEKPSTYCAPAKPERVPRKDEVLLRQETLIIGAIAATLMSIACFFVGYKVGYNKGTMNQAEEWIETIVPQQEEKKTTFGQKQDNAVRVPEKPAEKSERPSVIIKDKQSDQGKPIIRDKWTLRIVSYKNSKDNLERAKELAKTLQGSFGYDVFIVNVGKELYLCVGEFESNDSADLIKAQKQLANFVYENKKQFDSCYPIRMR